MLALFHDNSPISLETAKALLKKHAYVVQTAYDLLKPHDKECNLRIATDYVTTVYISHCFTYTYDNKNFQVERVINLQLKEDCCNDALVSHYTWNNGYPILQNERVIYRDYSMPNEKKLAYLIRKTFI